MGLSLDLDQTVDSLSGTTDTSSPVTTNTSELDIVDLFSIIANKSMEKEDPSYTRFGCLDHKVKSYMYGPTLTMKP